MKMAPSDTKHAARVRRVLLVPSWYPSPQNEVLGTFVREQAVACSLQHETVVLYAYEVTSATSRSDVLHENLREIRVPYVVPRNRHFAIVAYVMAVLRSLRRDLRRWRPDVIHVHVGYPAGVAALLAWARWRVPIVYTEHAGPLEEKLLSSRPSRAVVPLMARVAALGAPVSRFLQEDMRRAGILPRRSRLLPNAVDVSLFYPLTRRTFAPPCRLLTAALLVPGKGIEDAIDALVELTRGGFSATLTVAGDGPARDELTRYAQERGVAARVAFTGLLSKARLAALMREHDVFLMLSRRETFSVVVVEAMASGLPVVASRSGGPEEILDEATGILVDVGDVAATAQAVVEVTADPTRFVAGPAVAVERFSLSAVAQRLAELYAEVHDR